MHPEKKEKLGRAISSYVKYSWVFPETKDDLREFVVNLMKVKTKPDKNGKISICSNLKENLVKLSAALNDLFGIETKVSGECFNGRGIKYYEIAIRKKSEKEKLFYNNLIS